MAVNIHREARIGISKAISSSSRVIYHHFKSHFSTAQYTAVNIIVLAVAYSMAGDADVVILHHLRSVHSLH